jgi:predicted nucleic acid-binding protein
VATYLLDTGIAIDVLNDKRGRSSLLDRLLREGGELAACPITITEVYAGVRPREEARTERFLRSLKFYPVTFEVAEQAGNLQNAWRRKGRTLSLPDVTIAAVAIANHLVLVTANVKDFPMPELSIHPVAG